MFYVKETEHPTKCSSTNHSSSPPSPANFHSDLKHELMKRQHKRHQQMRSSVDPEHGPHLQSSKENVAFRFVSDAELGSVKESWAQFGSFEVNDLPSGDSETNQNCESKLSGYRSKSTEDQKGISVTLGAKVKEPNVIKSLDVKFNFRSNSKANKKSRAKKRSHTLDTTKQFNPGEIEAKCMSDHKHVKPKTRYNYDEIQTENIKLITTSLAMMKSRKLCHVEFESNKKEDHSTFYFSDGASPPDSCAPSPTMTQSVLQDAPISTSKYLHKQRKSTSMGDSELRAVIASAKNSPKVQGDICMKSPEKTHHSK